MIEYIKIDPDTANLIRAAYGRIEICKASSSKAATWLVVFEPDPEFLNGSYPCTTQSGQHMATLSKARHVLTGSGADLGKASPKRLSTRDHYHYTTTTTPLTLPLHHYTTTPLHHYHYHYHYQYHYTTTTTEALSLPTPYNSSKWCFNVKSTFFFLLTNRAKTYYTSQQSLESCLLISLIDYICYGIDIIRITERRTYEIVLLTSSIKIIAPICELKVIKTEIEIWHRFSNNQQDSNVTKPQQLTMSCFISQALNHAYSHFTKNLIPCLVDVNCCHSIGFTFLNPQQDGASSHYGRNVLAYLNDEFPRRWIGRRGEIEWPDQSLDLTTLDYFL
ncbi:hypothetical protein PV325_003289 [Microctonus aethiopoides]|nr:hypothetical protein PV325_003289 [Microctonus aethiopoides]